MKNILFAIFAFGLASAPIFAQVVEMRPESQILCHDTKSGALYMAGSFVNHEEIIPYVRIIVDQDEQNYGASLVQNGEGISFTALEETQGLFSLSLKNNDLSKARYTKGDVSYELPCDYLAKIESSSAASLKKYRFILKNERHQVFKTNINYSNFEQLSFILNDTIGDIGDWEWTTLNSLQLDLVNQKLKKENKEFVSTLKNIEKNSELQIMGILFARDWYYGVGTVGITVKLNDLLIVIPIDFDGGVVFGDERLDYVY